MCLEFSVTDIRQTDTRVRYGGSTLPKKGQSCLILAREEIGIGNLALFSLEDILTIELLIEHIFIGFTKFKSKTLF